MPILILWAKFGRCEMANDTGHGHGAIAPRWTETKIEFIVFNVRIARDATLFTKSAPGHRQARRVYLRY